MKSFKMNLKCPPWVTRDCDILVIWKLNNPVTAMVLSEMFTYTRLYLWTGRKRKKETPIQYTNTYIWDLERW